MDLHENEMSLSDVELRQRAYEGITEMLLKAGYFRVRIGGLSDFDKVVGGLCWAITASGVNVDVDLFFQENSTIGQRIRLSENIVVALRSMKCPRPLQAHQIHGGDFPALKPVIAWLVENVLVTRETTGDLVRLFSELQFDKAFSLPGDEDSIKTRGGSFFASVDQRFRPARKYRFGGVKHGSEEERVRSVLLEYGEKLGAGNNDNISIASHDDGQRKLEQHDVGMDSRLVGFEKQYREAQHKARLDEESRLKAAQELEAKLMQNMAKIQNSTTKKTSGKVAAEIVHLESEAIRSAAKQYAKASSQELAGEATTAAGQFGLFRRQKAGLEKKIRSAQTELEVARNALEQTRIELRRLGEQQKETNYARVELERKIEWLKEQESGKTGYQEDIARLRALVVCNETLKMQEKQFKENCRRHLEELKSKAQASASEQGLGESKHMDEIERVHAELETKFKKLLKLQAKRNQQVALISRKIDDIPTRSELIQYERRFVELYEQVATKLQENRRHVMTYNTLERTYDLMKKEESLLRSVSETFQSSMQSQRGRDQYLSQLDDIVKGLRTNLEQLTGKLDKARTERDEKQNKYQKLVLGQRAYFQAVREFQLECDKNQALLMERERVQEATGDVHKINR